MSRMIKVYNEHGSVVDSFLLPTKEMLFKGHPTLRQMITELNLRNLFVKRQLGKNGKPKLTLVTKEMAEHAKN